MKSKFSTSSAENVSKMEINDIIATVKSVSEFKIDIQDYLDFLAVWYRDILYFKATKRQQWAHF